MRKWLSAICIILMLLPLTACATAEESYRESELNPDTGISLRALYPIYDEGCEYISYVLENNSEDTIEFGSYFHLERQVGRRWKRVKTSIPVAFEDILYFAMPGTTRYESCYLNAYRDNMGEGRYRIVREIEGAWYTAEFEIGDSPITALTPHGFVPLEELPEKYSPEQAEADGVVVLREGTIVNADAMSDFFSAWMHHGFRGQLRVMHEANGGWILTDLILGDSRNTEFRVTLRTDDRRAEALGAVKTSYYGFFHVEDNCLWLSNYRDFETHEETDQLPDQGIAPSYCYHGSVKLFGGTQLPEQIIARIDDTHNREMPPRMIVWSPDGKIKASVGRDGELWLSTESWGTVWGGKHSGMPIIDLRWQDANTLMVAADSGESGRYLYEFFHIDAEDMKSIRTLSYTYSSHSYITDKEGHILIPE